VVPTPVATKQFPLIPYAIKRVLDYLIAVVATLVAVPLCIPIALLIKLDSPGPILFRQQRVGRGRRNFPVLKFRTMYTGVSDHAHREFVRRQLAGTLEAEGQTPGNGNGNPNGNGTHNGSLNGTGAPVYKLIADTRVTRVGRFLRRTSLDELPQLINVLRGEMSIVGPRPPLPYELDDYEPWQFLRLSIMPGLTGLWQVSGRNLLSYRQMCEIDITYIQRWSLWLDFKILLKTVPVVLFHSEWTA
jgi:lipopolysaccharide/colanic/teichoic acid biosynthesis glycosyltransferase